MSVAYIELSPTEIAKKVTVTTAEAQQYYQAHLVNYQLPLRWRVSQITLPLSPNAKAQANEIATAFKNNKNTGYVSTTVTLSVAEVTPSLRSALNALAPGQVTAPIRTANGLTLLKLIKKLPAQTHSFSDVKNNVMTLLQHQKINAILTKDSSTLAEVTYTNPDSLTLAAKTLNLPIQISPMMTSAGEKTGLFSNPKVLAAVFSQAVFQSNNNSNVIDLGDGTQVVLRVHKKNPAQTIPLSSVSAKIKTQLLEKQASAQAGLLAYQIQKNILAGKNTTAVIKKSKLQWHSVPLMSAREKSNTPEPILAAVFSTPVKEPKAVLINPTDYAVVLVTQLKTVDPTATPASQKQTISQQLSTFWGQVMQHCLVDSVMTGSHIKITKA